MKILENLQISVDEFHFPRKPSLQNWNCHIAKVHDDKQIGTNETTM